MSPTSVPPATGSVRVTRGNAADRAYLAAAEAGLVVAMSQSASASAHGAPREGRSLARQAHEAQLLELGQVQACAASRRWPGPGRPDVPEPSATPGPDAPSGDFATRLADHARAAIGVARAEMVAGSDPVVRHLAEASIRAHSRQLSDLAAAQPVSSVLVSQRSLPGQVRGRS